MGNALMPPDENRIYTAIGLIQGQLTSLSDKVIEFQQDSTEEHRKVHVIIDSLSEAVRNLVRIVEEMKPLIEDYRDKRFNIADAIVETKDYQLKKAEARGAARLAGWLYTAAGVAGGILVVSLDKIFSWLMTRPHP